MAGAQYAEHLYKILNFDYRYDRETMSVQITIYVQVKSKSDTYD